MLTTPSTILNKHIELTVGWTSLGNVDVFLIPLRLRARGGLDEWRLLGSDLPAAPQREGMAALIFPALFASRPSGRSMAPSIPTREAG